MQASLLLRSQVLINHTHHTHRGCPRGGLLYQLYREHGTGTSVIFLRGISQGTESSFLTLYALLRRTATLPGRPCPAPHPFPFHTSHASVHTPYLSCPLTHPPFSPTRREWRAVGSKERMRVTQDRGGGGRNLLAIWWAGCPLRWWKRATSTATQASHGVAAGTFSLRGGCVSGREGTTKLTRRIPRESDASEEG